MLSFSIGIGICKQASSGGSTPAPTPDPVISGFKFWLDGLPVQTSGALSGQTFWLDGLPVNVQ